MTREQIYSALFSLIQTACQGAGVVTVSRKLMHWTDISAQQQPAVFQIQKDEEPEQKWKVPTKWKLNVDLYVYVNTSANPNTAPSSLLNPIIDAIEAVLLPNEPNGPQTLGGLVSHAWISGKIETSEGVLGPQEVAIIPVEILADQ